MTQLDSVGLCHLHAAKRIVKQLLHVQLYIDSPVSDPEPGCAVCVKAKRALSKHSLHYPHPAGLLTSIW